MGLGVGPLGVAAPRGWLRVYVEPYYDNNNGQYVYQRGYWSQPTTVSSGVVVHDHTDGRPPTAYYPRRGHGRRPVAPGLLRQRRQRRHGRRLKIPGTPINNNLGHVVVSGNPGNNNYNPQAGAAADAGRDQPDPEPELPDAEHARRRHAAAARAAADAGRHQPAAAAARAAAVDAGRHQPGSSPTVRVSRSTARS